MCPAFAKTGAPGSEQKVDHKLSDVLGQVRGVIQVDNL